MLISSYKDYKKGVLRNPEIKVEYDIIQTMVNVAVKNMDIIFSIEIVKSRGKEIAGNNDWRTKT